MLQTSVLLICLCLGVGHSLGTKGCPDSYQHLYYKDMCYKLVNHIRSYWDARKDCMSTGGDLAVIKSEDVNIQVKALLQWYFLAYRPSVWIGLSDVDKEGSFVWSDGTALTYSNWGYKQGPGWLSNHTPDGRNVIDEDCVAMKPNGKWRDHQCTEHWFFSPRRFPYLCQFKLVSHPTTTVAPTTPEPTTPEPTTPEPTTPEPTTPESTTPEPTTPEPTTPEPTTPEPTTPEPTTPEPTTQEPTSPEPTTPEPTTPEPTTPEPTTPEPTTPEPTTPEPTTPEQEPTSKDQTTPSPTCPPFVCTLDCRMDGYTADDHGCSLCKCDV